MIFKMFRCIDDLDIEQFMKTALPTINSLTYSYFGESNQFNQNTIIRMINRLNAQNTVQFWEIMSQIYQCETKHIQQYYSYYTKQLIQMTDLKYHRHKKQTSEKVQKFQQELKAALINTIYDFGKSVSHSISDRELCVLVNSIVENDATQQFWNRVTAQVRSKTKKQLYDFYHTSFSKALYDSNITKEDKALIEQLNQEQPEKKPAELAQTFLEQTGRNVLKHSVVMCFVYIRRNISSQQKYSIQSNIE
ncbi:Hypothetical_protein [Hexamita inflata]|uniref:Hypothetical_protein n=1 Tax=Hexamita inflata TaxID=28002 RepID=A0AA86RE65_9EUKA|nr:Hypothetical protein HINF_LOCUS58374 [Hexamita inflata]